jgi:hypothetical protein
MSDQAFNASPERLIAVAVSGQLPQSAPARNIVFHGVNKSGSLSMTNVMRKAYAAAGRGDDVFSRYHGRPQTDEALLDIVYTSAPRGALFVNHYLYGAVDLERAGAIMVTQFRHPLPRIISVHQWLKREHVRKQKTEQGFPTLEEFVAKSRGTAHSQICQIGVGFGPEWRERMVRVSAKEALELALANLERGIAWFGLAEFFEESIFVLAAISGLTAVPTWEKDDRNEGRTLVWDLAADKREMIEHHYKEEFAFYAHAKSIFLSRINRLTFGAELQAYRAACAAQYKDRIF